MLPYGKRKRHGKLHPHDECGVCSEDSALTDDTHKGRERRRAKDEITAELDGSTEEPDEL